MLGKECVGAGGESGLSWERGEGRWGRKGSQFETETVAEALAMRRRRLQRP